MQQVQAVPEQEVTDIPEKPSLEVSTCGRFVHLGTQSIHGYIIKRRRIVFFVFYCHVAEKTRTGFFNWKKTLEAFDKHQCSLHHRDCLDQLQATSSQTKSVCAMLKKGLAEEQAMNRQMLTIIISSILYLSRQGLPLRSRYKVSDDEKLKGA